MGAEAAELARRCRRGLWLALALTMFCAGLKAQAALPTPLHITQAQFWPSASTALQQPASLDLLDAGDRALLATDTPWTDVALPHTRERSLRAASEAAPAVWWYRMRVPAAAQVPQATRLYLPRWQTTGTLALYVNGRLAWRSRGDQAWSNFNHPLWVDVGSLLQPGEASWVHLRMAGQAGVGGALSTLWLGSDAELLTRWRWRTFLQKTLVSYWRGSYLMLGLFGLGLAAWLRWGGRSRGGTLPLESYGGAWSCVLFFGMALAQSLAALLYLVGDEGLDMPFTWFTWMALAATLCVPVFTVYFLGLVQHRPRPRLGLALALYTLVMIVLTMPTWWSDHTAVLPLLRMALLPSTLVQIYVVTANAWHLRSRSSVLLAAWGWLALPLGLHDAALQWHLLDIEGLYLLPYLNLGQLTLFLCIAFQRYIHALDSAAQAHTTLTQRLAAQEQELVQTHERLRSVERGQILLEERQRLMRDMHDGVGSSLISALRLVEHGRTPPNVAQVLKECIDDLKIAIDSLESPDADLLGLLGALRFRLGPRLAGAGITLRWHISELPLLPWLDAQSALHVLRILQEVLTNIIKHSGATEIRVTTGEALSPAGDGMAGVQVCVYDNGDRFAPPSPDALVHGRRGLANVRSRAQALGADCAWQPAPERGNVFALWLPLCRAEDAAYAVRTEQSNAPSYP